MVNKLVCVIASGVRGQQDGPSKEENSQEEPALVLEELEVKEAIASEHMNHRWLVNNLDDAQGVHPRNVDAQPVGVAAFHLLHVDVARP